MVEVIGDPNEMPATDEQLEETPVLLAPIATVDPMVAIIAAQRGQVLTVQPHIVQTAAIVSEVAGTTRDRLIAQASWKGRPFLLIDTGGLEDDPDGHIPQRVQQQGRHGDGRRRRHRVPDRRGPGCYRD